MPTYEFQCNECKHEWELFQSMSAPDPSECPSCKHAELTKLCSLGSRGIVELTGQDLMDKVKVDTQQLKKDAAKSEKLYANMLGEDKYQALQVRMDNQKRERRR